ncbi:hypothetical protein [Azospirillum sp. BE72]|uniref:hypothetical protein n=1 Tax=Azospirillum sp. BE72 TaxID=2817776 RepID=UPI00285F4DA0|nr:hypothetical protein [Azospirillum sp. BE72]MDR6769848.1 hypothetical protein [Azospirillum sp. BE72]
MTLFQLEVVTSAVKPGQKSGLAMGRRQILIGAAAVSVAPISLVGCSQADFTKVVDTASAFVVATLTSFRELLGFKNGKTEVAAAGFTNPTQSQSSGVIKTNFYYSSLGADAHLARLQNGGGANYFESAFEPIQSKTERITIMPEERQTLVTTASRDIPRGTYAFQYITAIQKYDPTNSQIYLIEL